MDQIYWALLLLFGGAFLLILEFFVPSAGILGGLAAACFVGSVIIGFTVGPVTGAVFVVAVLFGVPLLLALMIKIWPLTPIGKRLFLSPPTNDQVQPYQVEELALRELIGRTGVAQSAMLPAGIVRIDRHSYDAVADCEAIDPGEKVIVKAVRMKRLVVRKVNDLQVSPSVAENADVLSRPLDEFGLESLDLSEED